MFFKLTMKLTADSLSFVFQGYADTYRIPNKTRVALIGLLAQVVKPKYCVQAHSINILLKINLTVEMASVEIDVFLKY